ncbi:MAG: ATP-binding cassette domain-containing protein [Anaerolineae bacterium]|nr:ATP-binding cassette domain-containing protein [Anaerolineae bacterium]
MMKPQATSASATLGGLPTTTATTPAVEMRGVSVRYGDLPALGGVTLSIPVGQMVAIVGPNGAGKSTLFKALVGLAALESGEVRVFGRPTAMASAAEVSYVAQRGEFDRRFPVHVVTWPLMGRYPHLGWFRRPGAADRCAAHAALDRVGMADLADRQIGQLSGGSSSGCSWRAPGPGSAAGGC